jgi:hypothetical protein
MFQAALNPVNATQPKVLTPNQRISATFQDALAPKPSPPRRRSWWFSFSNTWLILDMLILRTAFTRAEAELASLFKLSGECFQAAQQGPPDRMPKRGEVCKALGLPCLEERASAPKSWLDLLERGKLLERRREILGLRDPEA